MRPATSNCPSAVRVIATHVSAPVPMSTAGISPAVQGLRTADAARMHTILSNLMMASIPWLTPVGRCRVSRIIVLGQVTHRLECVRCGGDLTDLGEQTATATEMRSGGCRDLLKRVAYRDAGRPQTAPGGQTKCYYSWAPSVLDSFAAGPARPAGRLHPGAVYGRETIPAFVPRQPGSAALCLIEYPVAALPTFFVAPILHRARPSSRPGTAASAPSRRARLL